MSDAEALQDAFTSYLLLLTLSQLARRGRTVILSIHAPRSDAYDIFDRIALLSKGEIVYSGPRADCLGWFYMLGHDVQRGVNPLGMLYPTWNGVHINRAEDFLIDISSVDNRDAEKEEVSSARVKILIDAWRSRSREEWAHQFKLTKKAMSSSATTVVIDSMETEIQRIATGPTDVLEDQRRPGFWRQTTVLTARAHRNVYRNVPQLIGFTGQAIALGLIIGLTYYQLPEVSSSRTTVYHVDNQQTPTGIQSLKNLSFQLVPGAFYLQQVFCTFSPW